MRLEPALHRFPGSTESLGSALPEGLTTRAIREVNQGAIAFGVKLGKVLHCSLYRVTGRRRVPDWRSMLRSVPVGMSLAG